MVIHRHPQWRLPANRTRVFLKILKSVLYNSDAAIFCFAILIVLSLNFIGKEFGQLSFTSTILADSRATSSPLHHGYSSLKRQARRIIYSVSYHCDKAPLPSFLQYIWACLLEQLRINLIIFKYPRFLSQFPFYHQLTWLFLFHFFSGHFSFECILPDFVNKRNCRKPLFTKETQTECEYQLINCEGLEQLQSNCFINSKFSNRNNSH